MKALFFVCYLCTISPFHSWSQNRIKLEVPTAKQEAQQVWRTIQDLSFFEQHGYSVNLPKGALIDTLMAKSKSNRLSQDDYPALERFMEEDIYRSSDYQKGSEKIISQIPLINRLVKQLSKQKRSWNFKEYEQYTVLLTLYGSGGGYNPDNGVITLFTRKDGSFKQYKNPANTLMHEITHIGMETSIIQQFKVPHVLKERIVDMFISLNFEKELPTYRVQDMGETQIDSYLRKKKDLRKLDKYVEKYLKEKK